MMQVGRRRWVESLVCLFVELSLQGQGLVSVADVPVSELVGLDATCSHCLPVLVLCLLLLQDVLHHGLHQWRWVAGGDELSVVMALNVFHVFIIGVVRGIACPCVTLDQVICNRLHNVAILAYDVTE